MPTRMFRWLLAHIINTARCLKPIASYPRRKATSRPRLLETRQDLGAESIQRAPRLGGIESRQLRHHDQLRHRSRCEYFVEPFRDLGGRSQHAGASEAVGVGAN